MTKKLNWLDQFAKDYSEKMNKTASLEKKAEQAVVDAEDISSTEQGATVQFNGEDYKVVDASYSDDKGPGVLIEKVAAGYEGLEGNPMDVAMGTPATSVTPSSGGQQYHYDLNNNTQQTYTNDEDAQYGQSSAPATESEIAGENAVDRTTVPGHYTKSPGLNAAPALIAVPVDGGAVVETTEAPAVETTTEVPVEAPAATEAPVEETTTEEAPEVAEETTEDEKKEDKLASNRIMARIFNSRK